MYSLECERIYDILVVLNGDEDVSKLHTWSRIRVTNASVRMIEKG